MRKIYRLRYEAARYALARGHRLGTFRTVSQFEGQAVTAEAKCRMCGMVARYNSALGISGEAVAMKCK